MDDAVIVEEDPEIFQTALNIAQKYTMDESDKKRLCKIGNTELDLTEKYTYLGEIVSQNGKLDEHPSLKQQNIKGQLNQIRAMTKETVMNRMSLEPQMTWYRSTILSTLLYGCETWTLEKKQDENMEQIQLKCLTNILHAEKSTPILALYMETGIMPLKYQMDIRKLNYIYKILQVEESRWQKILLYEQIQSLELRNNIGQEWFRLMQNMKCGLH